MCRAAHQVGGTKHALAWPALAWHFLWKERMHYEQHMRGGGHVGAPRLPRVVHLWPIT